MDAVLYDLINKKNYQIEKFTSSGTFTAKKTGVHFINGCGAGASAGFYSGSHYGGGGGAGCKMVPVFLIKGESVTVTIGAGGIGGTIGSGLVAPGGTTSFGIYISLPGGGTSLNLSQPASSGGLRGDSNSELRGKYISGAKGGGPASYSCSSSFDGGVAGTPAYDQPGGGGGMFGPGANGNSSGSGFSAAANSGAGGGCGSSGTYGNGGSGYLEVIYLS